MKKTLLFFITIILTFTCVMAFADSGELDYAEVAPGGEVTTVEELIAAFGTNSYGKPNAELLAGSNTEVRLKNSIILQSTLVIKSGSYTLVGSGCTVARSEDCGTAIELRGGSLSIERENKSAEFGEDTEANIVFEGQNKSSSPFIRVFADASLTLNSKVLAKNMLSTENGAFIYADGNANVKIYASRFEGCKSKNGGAIYVSKSSDGEKRPLEIEKSTFFSCTAENGGAIYSEGYVYISSSTLDENTATLSGGAMYFSGGSELQSVSANNNKAQNGGVLFNEGVAVAVSLNAFYNEAENGGAIYNKSSCLLSDIYFFENKSSDCGGGVYNEGAFYLNSGSIVANDSANYGGGVYSTSGSILKIELGEISSCESEYAGGIYSAGDLIMTGGAVGKNYGSAPHVAVFGKFEMGGDASCYGGNVIGLVQKSDKSYPTITLKSALTSTYHQRVALYKLSGGDFKRSNASGVKIFEGSDEALASAFKQFNAYSGGVLPFELAENGELRRAFPTVLVIVTASALAVGAIGFVVGKKVIMIKKRRNK